MITRLWALVQLALALLLGGVHALRFLLKTPADRLRAGRRVLDGYRRRGPATSALLTAASEGLHPIDPQFLGHPVAATSGSGIVIYFTGTGETPHAPLPAYRRLMQDSELSGFRHYVVEAPWSRGAYYGSAAFSSRMWEHLLPLVLREPGPFLFVGLSRGAIAALDNGARVAEEQGKVAAVLAMSPPFKLPTRLPDSIVEVAKLEPVVERISIWLPRAPGWAQRLVNALVRRVHLMLTAVVHAELGMLTAEDFAYAALDVEMRGAIESSARAVREFRLLVEAPDRELEHFTNRVAAAAARTPRFFASLVWGEDDSWAPAAACHARFAEALSRESTPFDRATLTMLPGRGHGLFREHAHALTPLVTLLIHARKEAEARSQAQRARAAAEQSFEQKLLETPPGFSHD